MIDLQDKSTCPTLEEIGEYVRNPVFMRNPLGAKNNDSHSEKQAIVIFYTMFTLPSIENLCNGGVRGEDDRLVPALHGEFQGVQAPDKGIEFLFRGIVIGF